MGRIRSIKPDFFLHEGLAELSALHRLLFVGLWTLADRHGRLEDRPKRIKASLLPWEDCDVEALLAALAAGGFIVRYQEGGKDCIAIPGFGKHQRPHPKEADFDLPPPPKPGNFTEGREISGRAGKRSDEFPSSPAGGGGGGGSGKESLGVEATRPPDPLAAPGGLTVPAVTAGAQPERRATPRPPDMGVGGLRDAMSSAWFDRHGVAFDWPMPEERAIQAALGKAGGDEREVLRRWHNAVQYVAFPICNGVLDLVKYWNRYGTAPPTAPGKGRAPESAKYRADGKPVEEAPF